MKLLEPSCAELELALRLAWGVNTTSDPDGWSPLKPAWGQCAVTALVVQDELGGGLLRSPSPSGSHYWNRLPDGQELDLTREQFSEEFVPELVEIRDRHYVFSFEQTRRRYKLLRARVRLPIGA